MANESFTRSFEIIVESHRIQFFRNLCILNESFPVVSAFCQQIHGLREVVGCTSSQQIFHALCALAFLAIFRLCMNLRRPTVSKTQTSDIFVYSESALNKSIASRIVNKVGQYNSPWWYHPLLGTIFPFGGNSEVEYISEVNVSSDSENFVVDWYPNNPFTFSKQTELQHINPIVIFLPGLGIDSSNKICKRFILMLSEEGYCCAVINPRGYDRPMKTSKLWYPALHHDCESLLCRIENNLPKSNVFLVGYSSGSQIIQRTFFNRVRERRGAGVVRGALCVCTSPHDYPRTRQRLESTLIGQFLSACITNKQKEALRENLHMFNQKQRKYATRALRAGSLASMVDPWMARVYGYETEMDYYEAVSCQNYKHVLVPMYILQPNDDPLHTGDTQKNLNLDLFSASPNIIYHQPAYGNHFGFYEGPILEAFSCQTSHTYPAKIAIEFFSELRNFEIR